MALNACCLGIVSSFSPIDMYSVSVYAFKCSIQTKVVLTSYEHYLNFCRVCKLFSITTVHEVMIRLTSMWYYEPHHFYDWLPNCVKKLIIYDNVFVKKLFHFESNIETMVIEQSCVDIILPKTLKHLEVKRLFSGNIQFEPAVHLETISMDCIFTYYDKIHDLPDSVHEITITEDFLARITRWPSSLKDLIIKCTHNDITSTQYALMLHTPLPKSVTIHVKVI